MASNGQMVNVVSAGNRNMTWSRQAILTWVNFLLKSKIQKVDDLCTGAAYCCLMDILVPNSVQLNRIRMTAFQESDYIYNLEVLERTFKKLKVDKTIPIHKMAEGKFQDNYEFAVWFRNFFEANFNKMPDNYDVLERRQYQPFIKGFAKVPKVTSNQLQQSKRLQRSKQDEGLHTIIRPKTIEQSSCNGNEPLSDMLDSPMQSSD